LSTLDESASNEELDGFNVDWMGKYKGQSRVVVKPKNTQEVADVMKYCYEQGIAIVPQGGNTGLVGTSKFCVCSQSLEGLPGVLQCSVADV
jgi:FAD/FMN-containing dehydrogenase